MKVLMQPIQMVAKFDLDGNLTPARFLFNNMSIDVEQVIETREEKLAGNPMKIFTCQSEINEKLVTYELKFELKTCKWFL